VHFFVLAVAAAPALAQVYKWVDERGVTHYGERPPRGSKATEVQNKLASPPPSRAPASPAQKGATGAGKSGEPTANPGPTGVPPPSPAPAAKAPLTPQEEKAAARKAECDSARTELARLRQGTRSILIGANGERTILDNSAAIFEAEKRVSRQCGA
jgi:hypothetical protein